ncbi:hypothetical protein COY17_02885 [Candidatus Saccharibacteria bacterium CG_4_10_14_0_2_um_filter_52_9]|nr:MAG: hypothetical protein COY17_02885 [Candidatus Saccharibacteria bacterium CG_4_10_14_0_2_um_filter_52_9]
MGKQTKKASILFILAVCVLALIVGGVLLLTSRKKSSATLTRVQIANLAYKEDCGDKAMSAAGKQVPSKSDLETGITLLSYRANCYRLHHEYQQAINEYTQLASFFRLKNDTAMVELTDNAIADVKEAMRTKPRAPIPAKPDADPQLERELKRL